jgi:O-antigen/teichoic acid export membrane protein
MAPAAMPLRVLLLCSSFTMLNALALSVLLSMDRQVFIFKIIFVAAIFNVVLDIVLIQYFSLAGAVAASVITHIGFTLACQSLVSRMLNTRLPYLEYIKIFAISYVLLIPLFVVYSWVLNIWLVLLGGCIFVMLYFFLVMYWFKLSREEVSIIHSYAEKVPVLKSIFSNKLYMWIDARYELKFG